MDGENVHGGVDILDLLPAMPKQNLREMRGQAAIGCCVVSGIIVACNVFTYISTTRMPEIAGLPFDLPSVLNGLVYAESCVALICLWFLMYGDPGVIERSEKTCLPVPSQIARKLRAGEPINAHTNIEDSTGKTYCVRCFVWREGKGRHHHCSTCQRCVTHFDHHCGVFGRCIAGRCPSSGNIPYFYAIIGTGFAGAGTATVAACTTLATGGFEASNSTQLRWLTYAFVGYITVAGGCMFLSMVCFGLGKVMQWGNRQVVFLRKMLLRALRMDKPRTHSPVPTIDPDTIGSAVAVSKVSD
eukprot:TRINITY_DN18031_c0_g1_i1.p1 TRINITY_DN18031_c0_g1~~TRINITY_DN18031_c0_g1_i1.p1  ORF type:complete len:300 (-),score=25.49 TRINITY_DN18031_c0_g1_i1:88-987(-)